jgi:hypothetical protein
MKTKSLFLISLFLLIQPIFANYFTKKAAGQLFTQALLSNFTLRNADYKLIEESLKISNTYNPMLAVVIESFVSLIEDGDIYVVTADFSKDGEVFRSENHLFISLQEVTKNGTYIYEVESSDLYIINSFFRVSDNKKFRYPFNLLTKIESKTPLHRE